MRVKKESLIGIVVIALLVTAFCALYSLQRNKERNILAGRITSLGNGGPPETIEGLRAAIGSYERQQEKYVKDAAQTGVYWKILATRLQDRGLHNEALEALERAVYYVPEDASLFFQTGISAGIAAKSALAFPGAEGERERLLALAESAYLRAIELDGNYGRPRYGIGVLYVFELNRPEDAVLHLERYLDIIRNDVDAMFVLARAYYMTGDFRRSIDLYDRIIALTKDENKRMEAENNKSIVSGLYRG